MTSRRESALPCRRSTRSEAGVDCLFIGGDREDVPLQVPAAQARRRLPASRMRAGNDAGAMRQRLAAQLPPWVAALILSLTFEAAAQSAVTNSNVNIRAGPDSVFPLVGWLPPNTSVRVFGCTSDRRWCDVASGRNRGWVHSRHLSNMSRGRPPTIAFSLGPYWDLHYRGRPWYSSAPQWSGWGTPGFRPPPPPPRPRPR